MSDILPILGIGFPTTPTDIGGTFVVEDGSIVAEANSYVSVAEADNFFALHLYGASWAAATTQQKQAALVMSTRTINASVVWKGSPITHIQRLQWPRQGVVLNFQLDLTVNPILGYENTTYPSFQLVEPNIVPWFVKAATCEYCRYILVDDRETTKDQSNVIREQVGPISVAYQPNTRPDILPESVIRYLRDYVSQEPSTGNRAAGLATQMRRG